MVSFSMQQGYMVLAPAGVCVGIGVFNFGALVQLVRMPPCHGGGHGFESHTHRKCLKNNKLAEVPQLVDGDVSKSSARKGMRVQVPPSARMNGALVIVVSTWALQA